jgi:nicotinamidase-related amidase
MITDKKGRELSPQERLDPARTALLVVDVQNDFALPAGVVAAGGKQVSTAMEMIERLKPLIDDAVRAGVLIVFVRTGYDEPVLSRALAEQFARRDFRNSLCLTGTSGADFVDAIAPKGLPNEVIVGKHRYSPFGGSDIDLVLRSNGIETVVLTGIVTEVCVESTARDAFFRDYRVVIAADCSSPFSAQAGAASQAVLNQTFGRLMPSAEIRDIWTGSPRGARGWHAEVKAASVPTSLQDALAPGRTALVLIDLQNDFCHAEGEAFKSGAAMSMYGPARERTRSLLAAARRAGAMVIHVTTEDAAIYRRRPPPADAPCRPGSWGARILDELAPAGDEQVVVKHRHSGFVDTRLDLLLRANDIRAVVLAGVATHCAVDCTARDASMRDYDVVVAEDCVAAPDRQRHLHEAALENIAAGFGTVTSSSTIGAAWAIADDVIPASPRSPRELSPS